MYESVYVGLILRILADVDKREDRDMLGFRKVGVTRTAAPEAVEHDEECDERANDSSDPRATLPSGMLRRPSLSTCVELQIDTGVERFNAEWLFKTPVQIQGPVMNAEGEMITSFAGVNIFDAYGLGLEFRVDADQDGWPDKWDPNPAIQGFKDGINN